MNLDQDIRTMLRERVEGVAAAPVIPHGTVRRVRVRKALMAGGATVLAAALVLGGFAASRSLSNEAAPTLPAGESEREPTVVDSSISSWGERLITNMTATFVSPINGYSFKYVDRGGLEPAKRPWNPASQPSPIEGRSAGEYIEEFDAVETGYGAFFVGASTKIPERVSVDGWINEALAKYAAPLQLPAGCYRPNGLHEEITIDGEQGTVSQHCAEYVVGTVVKDGRIYLFLLAQSAPSREEAREVFDTWIDTIDLTPETAALS